jgi:hypothetical protein
MITLVLRDLFGISIIIGITLAHFWKNQLLWKMFINDGMLLKKILQVYLNVV